MVRPGLARSGDRPPLLRRYVRSVRGALGDRVSPLVPEIPVPAGRDRLFTDDAGTHPGTDTALARGARPVRAAEYRPRIRRARGGSVPVAAAGRGWSFPARGSARALRPGAALLAHR